MLAIPNATLICLTNKDKEGHLNALNKSCEGIEWGAVKLIWDEDITGIDEWNRKMVYELHRYVETDFAMVIHADGYVIDPSCWRDEFLSYDYIGAPWPLPQDDFSYRTPSGEIVRVGNSVSLRSRRLLRLPSELGIPWQSFYGNTNEDGFLCVHHRDLLMAHGVHYAPLEVARHFSREHTITENAGLPTFAFHTVDI